MAYSRSQGDTSSPTPTSTNNSFGTPNTAFTPSDVSSQGSQDTPEQALLKRTAETLETLAVDCQKMFKPHEHKDPPCQDLWTRIGVLVQELVDMELRAKMGDGQIDGARCEGVIQEAAKAMEDASSLRVQMGPLKESPTKDGPPKTLKKVVEKKNKKKEKKKKQAGGIHLHGCWHPTHTI